MISHAWLHMFGVPDGHAGRALRGPAHGPRVGLVSGRRSPAPIQRRALLRGRPAADVRQALDELLRTYLAGHG